MVLFVWIAGVELDLKRAWLHRAESLTAAALALGVPLVLGGVAAAALLRYRGWSGMQAHGWQFVLGVGMACAVAVILIDWARIGRQAGFLVALALAGGMVRGS